MNPFFCLLLIPPFLVAACPDANAGEDFFEAHVGLWTFASLLPATLSIFVSGIGLYFIWAQLKSSRQALADSSKSAKAAADAASISFAATRPWIKFHVKMVHLYFLEENPKQVGCQIDYVIKNIGNTPALNTAVSFKPLPVGYGIGTDIDCELNGLLQMKPHNPRVLFPNDIIEEGLSMNFDFPIQNDERMLSFKVIAAAIYKAVPDGEVFWTPAVLQLQHETPPEDRVYRFYRGMGAIRCIATFLGSETPSPT